MSGESTATSSHCPHETEVEEFARLVQSVTAQSIPVELDPLSASCIVAQLQLALRHPCNSGVACDVALKLCDGLIDQLAKLSDDPSRMRALLNRGYDPLHDVRLSQESG